ncbi:MAG: hypothetical protein LUQ54_06845 [Methanoregula sp.]|nr:hypothetical protein [Methanoregula sp.]
MLPPHTIDTAITKIFTFNNEMLLNEMLEMNMLRLNGRYCSFVLLIALICIIQPVLADAGSVTISYRGPGGYYIGDSITFDGKNTAGNSTIVKITGPGLPSEGVPLYDLNGIPGSGNTVPVTDNNAWRFNWFSANTLGIEKLVTARYTITAMDLTNPEKTATTSILLKKPEFYLIIQPGPIYPGDYVQLNGVAEKGVTYVTIDVIDSRETKQHTFVSPVSGTGSFSYGFRADMLPGKYFVTVSNPAMKNSLMSTLTIESPANSTVTSVVLANVTVTETSSPEITQPPAVVPSPTSALPLSPMAAITGIVISAGIILAWSGRNRK